MRTQTGLTGKAAEDLNASFKNVFGNTPADAETVSAAMGTLVQRTGATGAELEGLTTQVANLSRVTGVDATAAANAAADVFARWGVDTDEQSGRMDELFAASQKSGVSFDALSSSVAANQATFQGMGLTLGESIGLTAQLGKAGIDTAEVMPGLGKAVGAALKAGKDPGDALAATFAKIQSEGANSETAMKTFGKSGVKMAEAIASGALTLDDLSMSLGDTTNAINATAADTDDFGQKFDTFKNKLMVAIEPAATSLMDSLGVAMDKLAPLIPPVADALGKFFGWLAENPAIAATVAVIGVLAGVMGTIAAVAAPFLPVIMGIAGGFTSLLGVLAPVGAAIGGLAALFNPVTIVIGLIVAAVAGLKLAWDNDLGGIQEKTAAAVEAVKGFFQGIVDKVGEIVASVAASWEEFKSNLQAAMDSAGATITTAWTNFWTTITTKLAEIGTAVTAKWEEVKQTISDKLDEIWSTIQLRWDAFLREISDKLDAILGKVGQAWDDIKAKIQGAMDAVWATIQSLWAQIKDNIQTALDNIRTNVENIMGRVREIFDSVMGTIKQLVSDVMSHITSLWQGWIDFVHGVVDTFKKLISGDFAGAFETMKRTVQDGIERVKEFFTGMGRSIMDAIGNVTTLLSDVGHDLISGLVDGLKNSWHLVTDFLSNLLGDLVTLAKKILGIASPSKVMAEEVGRPMALGIGAGFSRAWTGFVLPMINKLLKDGGGITPPRLNPNEPSGWAGGLAPIGGWLELTPPKQETRSVDLPPPMRRSMGGLPPGGGARWDMGTPPMAGDMGNSWFGGASRTKVKPMQTGKGGFVQASKSNFWHIWVQRNGIPEESSARKTAEMLGIPLPDWLEEIYKPIAAENIKADGPVPGLTGAANLVAASLGGLATIVGEVSAKLAELLPIVTNRGTVPGTGPGGGTISLPGAPGGGLLPGPGGGGGLPIVGPIGPPGGRNPGPLTVETSGQTTLNAASVIVPNMTAYVTSNVSVAIQVGEKTIEALATIIDKRLAQRASVGVP